MKGNLAQFSTVGCNHLLGNLNLAIQETPIFINPTDDFSHSHTVIWLILMGCSAMFAPHYVYGAYCAATCQYLLTHWSVLGNDSDHLTGSFQCCCCLFMCCSSQINSIYLVQQQRTFIGISFGFRRHSKMTCKTKSCMSFIPMTIVIWKDSVFYI